MSALSGEDRARMLAEKNAELHEVACARVGTLDRAYRIAGLDVRVRFAGDALARQMMPALEHLAVEPDERTYDLAVGVWDSKSTGVDMVKPPCGWRDFTDRGNIHGLESDRYLCAFHYGESSVNTLDVETLQATFWVDDSDRLPFWISASPLRSILHWRLQRDGKQLVHAAVVGTDEGGVVIPGRGGSGKSTTALLCLRNGLRYVSDDYAVLALDPEPRAYSLYSTAKLEVEAIPTFPELEPLCEVKPTVDCEKGVVFLHPTRTDQVVDSLPLRGVLLPEITGRSRTTFASIEAGIVEQAATFTTMCQLPHTGRHTVEFMKRLSTEVPRAKLALGTRYEEIPDAVAAAAKHDSAFIDVARTGLDPGVEAADLDLPLVSVVVPVHNGAAFVDEAYASIAAQEYPRLELLFLNDGSTDTTADAIDALPADVRYFVFDTNLGAAETRNRGIREASADFIAFLDVDDLWEQGHLRRAMAAFAEAPAREVVQGDVRLVELDSGTGRYVDQETGPVFPYYIGSAVYRREAFEKNGHFDRTMRFGEDADWYLRAGEAGLEVFQTGAPSLVVRRHGGNMTEGRSARELGTVLLLKKALDRRRARGEA